MQGYFLSFLIGTAWCVFVGLAWGWDDAAFSFLGWLLGSFLVAVTWPKIQERLNRRK